MSAAPSFQTALLDALVSEVTRLNTTSGGADLRVVEVSQFANTGTLYVLHVWDEVVHLTYDFQRDRNTLVINGDPLETMAGPNSDTVFRPHPSNGAETRRLLQAWQHRIGVYRRIRHREVT